MSDDYTPGAGARTLEPVAGMLDTDGDRVLGLSGAPRDILTDRATFLLALDELARRVGLDPSGGVTFLALVTADERIAASRANRAPTPYGWQLFHPGASVIAFEPPGPAWPADVQPIRVPSIDTADPIEALDRALWATRRTP